MRKLLSTLIVVAAFAAPLTLHADPISGFFSATGTDSFTSSTITFNSAQVAGDIGGTKTVIASNLDIGLAPYPGGPPALVPTGVAVAKSGAIYVSSDIRNAMYKLTPPTP